MPLYHFKCNQCQCDWESLELKVRTAAGTPACPACGSWATRFVYHKSQIQFNGPGFYLTDKQLNPNTKSFTKKNVGELINDV